MADHSIRHEDQKTRGAFFIEDAGKRIAEMTYSRSPDGKRVVIDHTFVDPSLRGQGIAAKLVAAGVDWARADKVTVHPVCPFAKAVFDREHKYADVLEK